MKWEYKTIKIGTIGMWGARFNEEELDEIINKFGRAGWELISTSTINEGVGTTRYFVIIFKRPLVN